MIKTYRINNAYIIYAKTPIDAMHLFRESHPDEDIISMGEIKSSVEVERDKK